jgi:hypothetical protein
MDPNMLLDVLHQIHLEISYYISWKEGLLGGYQVQQNLLLIMKAISQSSD